MEFDIETLTIGEVIEIEEITGKSIDSMVDEGEFKGKTLKALCYVIKRRENSKFTLKQAENVGLKEIMSLMDNIEVPDDLKEDE